MLPLQARCQGIPYGSKRVTETKKEWVGNKNIGMTGGSGRRLYFYKKKVTGQENRD
jgi:hypothetical protein